MHQTAIENIIEAMLEAGVIRPEEVADLLESVDDLQQIVDLWS